MSNSVRAGYEKLGVEGYYKNHNEDYSNPHFNIINALLSDYIKHNNIGDNVLDLCCGSGEITSILNSVGDYHIDGLDPYTAPAYKKNTGKECLMYDFKDIVNGALENRRYNTIICSFAMHLCEQSMLNSLLYQLSTISENLIILTPHKRPEITQWWKEVYREKNNKVTIKVYKSLNNTYDLR